MTKVNQSFPKAGVPSRNASSDTMKSPNRAGGEVPRSDYADKAPKGSK